MARALTASRVTVSRDKEPAYLAALARLAGRLRTRGEHLWLFRDPAVPGAFLEFSESPSAGAHRTRRERDTEEAALERQLETIAAYAPGDGVLWEEVSLEER